MTQRKNKPVFKLAPNNFNFIKNERELLDWWHKSGLVKKYLAKNKGAEKTFSFIDGPITANNPMGVHHAWGRSLKDLYRRFKNMQGFEQRFQNGFDCQGLWVEVEVEKKLGFNSKKDIEKFGLDKFTQACIDRVKKYAGIQTGQSKRLGYFMDWENSYYTMSENNNLYIWAFLKKCHQKGLLYKNKSSTVWCPRCETGLSRHEQADGYKNITDTSVYVKFKIKGKENEYFLAWTTTPWTLSANILLAINPEYQYVKTNVDSQVFYLAQESADRLGLKDYSLIKAKDLLDLKYDSLYDIPAQEDVNHFVIEWKEVNPQEGTGIVHIAPGCGEEDFELGQKHKTPILSPLGETGHFGDGYGELTGKYAHDVVGQVVEHLKQKDLLYKTKDVAHSYPHCWRCGTKCLFRVEDNWFINLQEIKPDLKKAAGKAKWIPGYVGKRMQNWLDNMGDWMIGRKRFYGLSLPFYQCGECGELIVVGSKQELKKLAVEPGLVDKLPRLHRPWIDKVKIKCPKCNKQVKRVLDVGDCWLDAGVIPFSTLKYFEDKKYWQKWFPAKLVFEMVEQVRLWYYSMLVYGVIFENQIPYLNVLSHDEVRDENGERMSKTKGNGIPFDEAVEKMGADVMRWLYARRNPKMSVNFGYKIADEVRRQFIFLYWNSYKFFLTYASLNNFQHSGNSKPQILSSKQAQNPNDKNSKQEGLKHSNLGNSDLFRNSKLEIRNSCLLDRWIISRLESTKKAVEEKLDTFHHHEALKEIEEFLNDLSLWYIRRSRERVNPNNKDNQNKNNCLETLYSVLENLTLILSPFIPFLTETVWQGLHPETDGSVNESVHLQNWPKTNTELVDQKLEKQMVLVREVVTLGHAQRKINQLKVRQPLNKLKVKSEKLKVSKELVKLIQEELNIKKVEIEKGDGELRVELDMKITPELKEEGETRELIRQIQILRREAGLSLTDKITIQTPGWSKKWQEEILERTGAKGIKKAKELKIEKT